MKLLIVQPAGHIPGHTTFFTQALCKSLREIDSDLKIDVLSFDGFCSEWCEEVGFKHIRIINQNNSFYKKHILNISWLTSYRLPMIVTLLKARKLAKDYDTLHILDWTWLSLFIFSTIFCDYKKLVLNLYYKVPKRHGVLGLVNTLKNKLLLNLYKKDASIIVQSILVKDWLQEEFNISQDNFHWIPWGIDGTSTQTSNKSTQPETDHNASSARFLFFGPVEPRKGIVEFITALDDINRNDHIELTIAGPLTPASNLSEIQSALNDSGLIDKCSFELEYVTEERARELFHASDYLILNYPAHLANASGVLTKAAEYLLPVLATNHGDIGYYVREFGLGHTFLAGDHPSLVKSIKKACSDTPKDREILRQGLRKFAHEHSWEKVAEKHLRAYKKL